MLKITRIRDENLSNRLFHIRTVNDLEYCSSFLTIWGRTFQIKYSSKFNYFYIARQVRLERLLIDALTISFIRQLVLTETKKTLTSLKRISTIGKAADYYMRGILDGEAVFIKVVLTRLQADTEASGVMQNEYDKASLLSEECPYILKPLHYIASLPCEILILPYIHNLQPLNNILQSDAKAPVWLREQLQELITFLKSKKIVHRDVGGHNICIGNINDAPTQLFLNDLAYMTYLDDEGMPLPLSMEEHVKKVLPNWQNEDKIFSHLLRRIDQKIVADLESSSVLSRQ